MASPKLKNILAILHEKLTERGIAHALIGAMAMAVYGMPRYTADIDLMADARHRAKIREFMAKLGFDCFQDTDAFAQFDSEPGVYGKVDFMFARTEDGFAMLERAVLLKDEFFGEIPVVQPTDYAVLKLMAIANNPDRKIHDTADLESLFKTAAAGFVDERFQPIPAFPVGPNELFKNYENSFTAILHPGTQWEACLSGKSYNGCICIHG
jgi:hypothetical protein